MASLPQSPQSQSQSPTSQSAVPSHRAKQETMTDIYVQYASTYKEIPTFEQFQKFARKEEITIIYKDARELISSPPILPDILQSEIDRQIRHKKKTIHKSSINNNADDDIDLLNSLKQSSRVSAKFIKQDSNTRDTPHADDDDDRIINNIDTQNSMSNENNSDTQITSNHTQPQQQRQDKESVNNTTNELTSDTLASFQAQILAQQEQEHENMSISSNNTTYVVNKDSIDIQTDEKESRLTNELTSDTLASFHAQIQAQKQQETMENTNNNNPKSSIDSRSYSDEDHIRSLSMMSELSETPSAPPTPLGLGRPPAGSVPQAINGNNSMLSKFHGKLPPKPQKQEQQYLNKSILEQSLPSGTDSYQTVLCHEDDPFEFEKSDTMSTWVEDQID